MAFIHQAFPTCANIKYPRGFIIRIKTGTTILRMKILGMVFQNVIFIRLWITFLWRSFGCNSWGVGLFSSSLLSPILVDSGPQRDHKLLYLMIHTHAEYICIDTIHTHTLHEVACSPKLYKIRLKIKSNSNVHSVSGI